MVMRFAEKKAESARTLAHSPALAGWPTWRIYFSRLRFAVRPRSLGAAFTVSVYKSLARLFRELQENATHPT
ncbi:MAG: hypothetical protein DME76_03655 [Verrucomicrobia bacterium]|nr:MAG: hypothetical protein DME76_03655 [Verrucomicrobiota bacterium]